MPAKLSKALKIMFIIILGISAGLFIYAVLDIRDNEAVSSFTKGSLFWGVCLIGVYMFLNYYDKTKRKQMEKHNQESGHDMQK